ncbi:hypothetical protein FBUS_07543 [Fasciolopsis buskii]|uniref:Uncharacterized protein n=1 Tax=Fasciolopsis buskii TaxID=27845 RepID=A0A8E0VML0_9TREM|nr:hypothetical protein FBUS_07543 [Fasciolopsis buski]
MSVELQKSFNAFCNFVKKGSNTASDKTLKKICTDCNIYCKGLDANRVDIEFRAQFGNTKRLKPHLLFLLLFGCAIPHLFSGLVEQHFSFLMTSTKHVNCSAKFTDERANTGADKSVGTRKSVTPKIFSNSWDSVHSFAIYCSIPCRFDEIVHGTSIIIIIVIITFLYPQVWCKKLRIHPSGHMIWASTVQPNGCLVEE